MPIKGRSQQPEGQDDIAQRAGRLSHGGKSVCHWLEKVQVRKCLRIVIGVYLMGAV